MDEPVVVNPETDSNSASVKEGMLRLIIYGRDPKRESKNHARVTMINDSLIPKALLRLESVSFQLKRPVINNMVVERIKGNSFSLYITETIMLDDMKTPSSIRTIPNIWMMPLKFISAGLPTKEN